MGMINRIRMCFKFWTFNFLFSDNSFLIYSDDMAIVIKEYDKNGYDYALDITYRRPKDYSHVTYASKVGDIYFDYFGLKFGNNWFKGVTVETDRYAIDKIINQYKKDYINQYKKDYIDSKELDKEIEKAKKNQEILDWFSMMINGKVPQVVTAASVLTEILHRTYHQYNHYDYSVKLESYPNTKYAIGYVKLDSDFNVLNKEPNSEHIVSAINNYIENVKEYNTPIESEQINKLHELLKGV